MRQVRREITENPRYARSTSGTRGLIAYDVGEREGFLGGPTDDLVVVAEVLPVMVPIHGNVMQVVGYEVPITNITEAYQIHELRRNLKAYQGESAHMALQKHDAIEEARIEARDREMREEALDYLDTKDRISVTVPISPGNI